MRRGWIKLHIACDVQRHLITGVEVTGERTHDTKEFRALLDGERDSVGKVYGDTVYDSRKNFY